MSNGEVTRPVVDESSQPAPNESVVIVDDCREILSTLTYFLKEAGYEVHAAPNGIIGYHLIQEFRPRFVIVDVFMPHMGGLELAERIRSHPDLTDTYIVSITGMVDVDRDIDQLGGRADVYLPKPIDEEALLQALAEAPQRPSPTLAANE